MAWLDRILAEHAEKKKQKEIQKVIDAKKNKELAIELKEVRKQECLVRVENFLKSIRQNK